MSSDAEGVWRSGRGAVDPASARHLLAHIRDVDTSDEVPPEQLLRTLLESSARDGRYEVRGELARGGMGVILEVWDRELRRDLAMKVIVRSPDAGPAGDLPGVAPRTLSRFLDEAQITGQLDHPGIVPVHELGTNSAGEVFFTMRLVRGEDLRTIFGRLDEAGWTTTRALGVVLKACEAVAYAHDKGVIHRDLKPSNVMVGRFGEVYVMDWGLAKVLGRSDSRDLRIDEGPPVTAGGVRTRRSELAGRTPESPIMTMDGEALGTPAYMSPEQAQGRLDEMGPATDVYSAGAMLYHLLARHMPYVPAGERVGSREVLRLVREGPPSPLSAEAPEAPGELVSICEKAMARSIEARYPDMTAMVADLSAYVEGRVVRAHETGAWAEARKWVERNRGLAWSLLAAVTLLVAGLVSSLLLTARSNAHARRADTNAAAAQRNARRADAKTAEAEENLRLAERSERRAAEQLELARAERAKVMRLSDMRVLEELEAEAEALWPAHPDRLPALESWMERARELVTHLDEHRATLDQLRSSEGTSTPGPATEPSRARGLDRTESRWHHDLLVALIAQLEAFEAGLLGDDSIRPEFGWSVPRRIAFARRLEDGFRDGGEHARTWSTALPDIGERYPGLDLKPQMGLLPIGPDPESGLWEFAHLMTGAPAGRAADGSLVVTEETGAVLVLVPAGTFWMGAQSQDPAARNFDELAVDDESPVHEVELSAFFVSKYELTQAQWLAIAGANPSAYQLNRFSPTLVHPVEQVTRNECVVQLARAGLQLPSEAQWECAARAGTETAWWTGAERETLIEARAANLADQALARAGYPGNDYEDWPELDDGYAAHAPAGSSAPNGFGLHEVVGNLFEWCLDEYDGDYYARSAARDPVLESKAKATFVIRGGGYTTAAPAARSAYRGQYGPSRTGSYLGVRPARAVDP